MLKIAITGNIASGKSTVENILKGRGYDVFDADIIAHDILASSVEVQNAFNTLDRNELAKIVFSDNKKLRELEAIIHPRVKEEIIKLFNQNLDVVFISVPQLFETGFEALFDKVIFVNASEDIRLSRLMKRNGYTREIALKRINAQNDMGKAENSDFVIENNGDLKGLEKQLKNILATLNI